VQLLIFIKLGFFGESTKCLGGTIIIFYCRFFSTSGIEKVLNLQKDTWNSGQHLLDFWKGLSRPGVPVLVGMDSTSKLPECNSDILLSTTLLHPKHLESNVWIPTFFDALASPSTNPCRSVSEWVRFGYCYRISSLASLLTL